MAPHRDYFSPNQRAYLDYYSNQAGGGISRYRGADQYGYGLGSLLSSIIRKIIPIASSIVKPAAHIVKPHLKSAAKDLAVAAVKTVSRRIKKKRAKPQQKGGRRRKRKPAKKRRRRRRRKTTTNIF